jgi:8-oxo-dGTP pyrophosphatase MutT (NUDIX family)
MKMKRGARRQPSGDLNNAVIEQAGALCLRVLENGSREVLLVGSRRNGRWGLPKGHIDKGEASHVAAAREAYEEAGVLGEVSEYIVGSFVYSKDSSSSRYRVIVHMLAVMTVEEIYPETGLRAREWFTLEDAASVVGHDGLRELLRTFS